MNPNTEGNDLEVNQDLPQLNSTRSFTSILERFEMTQTLKTARQLMKKSQYTQCYKHLTESVKKNGKIIKLIDKLKYSRIFLKCISKLLNRRYMMTYEKKNLGKIEILLKQSTEHLSTCHKIINCFMIKAFPQNEIVKSIWNDIFSVPKMEERRRREEERKLKEINPKRPQGIRSSKRHLTTSLTRQGSIRDEIESDKMEDDRKEILEFIYNVKENFFPTQSKEEFFIAEIDFAIFWSRYFKMLNEFEKAAHVLKTGLLFSEKFENSLNLDINSAQGRIKLFYATFLLECQEYNDAIIVFYEAIAIFKNELRLRYPYREYMIETPHQKRKYTECILNIILCSQGIGFIQETKDNFSEYIECIRLSYWLVNSHFFGSTVKDLKSQVNEEYRIANIKYGKYLKDIGDINKILSFAFDTNKGIVDKAVLKKPDDDLSALAMEYQETLYDKYDCHTLNNISFNIRTSYEPEQRPYSSSRYSAKQFQTGRLSTPDSFSLSQKNLKSVHKDSKQMLDSTLGNTELITEINENSVLITPKVQSHTQNLLNSMLSETAMEPVYSGIHMDDNDRFGTGFTQERIREASITGSRPSSPTKQEMKIKKRPSTATTIYRNDANKKPTYSNNNGSSKGENKGPILLTTDKYFRPFSAYKEDKEALKTKYFGPPRPKSSHPQLMKLPIPENERLIDIDTFFKRLITEVLGLEDIEANIDKVIKELEMIYVDEDFDKTELEMVRLILIMKKKFGHFNNMSEKLPDYMSKHVEFSEICRASEGFLIRDKLIDIIKERKEKRRLARKELRMKKVLEQFEKKDNIFEDENTDDNERQQLRNMLMRNSQTLAISEIQALEERKRQSVIVQSKSVVIPENLPEVEKTRQNLKLLMEKYDKEQEQLLEKRKQALKKLHGQVKLDNNKDTKKKSFQGLEALATSASSLLFKTKKIQSMRDLLNEVGPKTTSVKSARAGTILKYQKTKGK